MTRTTDEAAGRAAAQPGRSPDRRDATPCVVGALLGGQPELALLVKAAVGVARLELVHERLAVVSTVLNCRPAVLVIPPFDAAHVSTAPLVLRLRRDAPGVGVLMISSHPAGAGRPVLRAVKAGAHVITSPTASELQHALMRLLEPGLPAQ